MEKYRSIVLFSLCIFILSTITTSFAKCPSAIYKIKGVIFSNDNEPLQNVFITVFLDKEEQGFTDISSEKGEFEIKYLYPTDKEIFIGNVCGKTPSSITAVVHKDNFFSKRVRFKIKNIKKEEYIFYLPLISLIKIHPTTLNLIK